MDTQVDRIGIRIKSAIQQACESLTAGVDEDLKNLQQVHKSTLESCELLRQQNILLQQQLRELLSKHASDGVRPSPASWEPRQISHHTQQLIDENPELLAILDRQATEYRRLEAAHSVLLTRLKEHQDVIIQLQRERVGVAQAEESDTSQLARLRSVIEPSQSNLAPFHTSAGQKIRPATAVAAMKSSRIQSPGTLKSRSTTKKSEQVVSEDSERQGSAGMQESRQGSAPAILVNISTEPESPSSIPNHTSINEDSQPVFVSERPVKRRRTGHTDRPPPRAIKMESSLAPPSDLGELHSIDLDAFTTPIVVSEARPADAVSLPRDKSARTGAAKSLATGRFSASSSTAPALSSSHLQTREAEPLKLTEITRSISTSPEAFMPPPRSASAEMGLQGKPYRSVLQAKSANMKLDKPMEGLKKRSMLSLDKQASESENMDPAPPTGTSVRQSPGTDKQLNINTSGRINEPSQRSPRKYATPLQRKRALVESRLRNKDIGELSVNDFVLNPAMNQGFKQTFRDADIGKTHRQCSATCSKPECCGAAFAAAIQSMDITSLQGRTSERDSLLRSYLGFPVSNLGVLSEQKYQQLMGEAMGKQFAEKCSKQKHYRAESPPGYWRADFPTTQEREIDRQQAEENERTVLGQRRKEALQDGGLWRFRDEV